MPVVVVGISHRSAPLAIRERVALSAAECAGLLGRFPGAGSREAVVLATCGRTELWAASSGWERPDAAALAGLLAEASGEPREVFEPYLEVRSEREAVVHLLRVAAGLDALVLGEAEILGQVARALEAALRSGVAGPVLSRLFRAALRAGRRARAETEIGRRAASVPSVAVDAAARALGTLEGRSVLVLGAGEMGALAVRALVRRGAGPLVVMSRTLRHAEALARPYGARALELRELPRALAKADVLVASTGAPGIVVTADQVRRAAAGRNGAPLVILDMALPRDVQPGVRALPNVEYLDLDDLGAAAASHQARRRLEAPRVEAIVQHEAERFLAWQRAASVTPAIADLRGRAEAVRKIELGRALRRMPNLSPEGRDVLEAFSRSLVNKLLHEPTTRLKASAGNGDAEQLAAALRRLFALQDQAGNGHGR
jgi:glutamyl-tRNA reductase